MAWMSEQAADRIDEALPNRPLVGRRAGSARGQRVDAPLPSGLRRRPMAAEQASLLEPMERRVNRPLRQLEGAAAAALDLLDHRIAMRRPARQRGEHDHVEVPFEHFAFHGPERYRLATLGVKPLADPLQAAIDRGAPFLERALELLGVLAMKKTSKFGLQRRERRGFISGEGLARGGERRPYRQRRRRGDLVRKIDGAIELFAWRRHFLDKAQAIRLRGTPFVAGEHVTHGVAPAGLTREADRGTAAGEDSARDFTLTKDGVVCRDADIRGQEELMPEVFGAAMHGDHDRLRAIGWPQADRVDVIRILGRELARCLRGSKGRAVDAEGKVAADTVEHGRA